MSKKRNSEINNILKDCLQQMRAYIGKISDEVEEVEEKEGEEGIEKLEEYENIMFEIKDDLDDMTDRITDAIENVHIKIEDKHEELVTVEKDNEDDE